MNRYGGDFEAFCRRQAVSWACGTLAQLGCKLEAEGRGWVIETPFGWRTADTARELTAVAREIQHLKQAGRKPCPVCPDGSCMLCDDNGQVPA